MIHEENRLLHKKLKDLEAQIQKVAVLMKNAQYVQDLNSLLANSIKEQSGLNQQDFADKVVELRSVCENLTRRLRFHRDYNLKQVNAVTGGDEDDKCS